MTPKRIPRLILLLVLIGLVSGLSAAEDLKPERMLAFLPELSGWRLTEKPTIYDYDNLFEYINGSAELYYSYGFVNCLSATFSSKKTKNRSITVDIYDQGSPLGAFGVYSSYSNPEYRFESLGCEAIVSPQQVRFWQDRYQVEIQSNSAEAEIAELLPALARQMAGKMPKCQLPEEIHWLTPQNQVPHTLKYIQEGFLGQDFLAGGLEALYQIDGVQVRGFVSRCSSPDQARQILDQFRQVQSRFEGAKIQDLGDHFESFHDYTGHLWVGAAGSWFYGASSNANIEGCRVLAQAIAGQLTSARTE